MQTEKLVIQFSPIPYCTLYLVNRASSNVYYNSKDRQPHQLLRSTQFQEFLK